jgi:hypothetical protein
MFLIVYLLSFIIAITVKLGEKISLVQVNDGDIIIVSWLRSNESFWITEANFGRLKSTKTVHMLVQFF